MLVVPVYTVCRRWLPPVGVGVWNSRRGGMAGGITTLSGRGGRLALQPGRPR